ncbi:uncharacterized protein [Paramisgurnus dabryanus]|uniref:uncharacterized protein n=1 Tax=Paramisgurnus dabryanus TaxID=90735 RepID=UPI0031F3AB16
MKKTFLFLCLFLFSNGVAEISDADKVKSASVNEGDSLTLHTDAELQNDDQIFWWFLNKDILLLQFHKLTNRTSLYDSADGTFRDRLHLNHKTGDLTITNIKAEHTGLYQVEIINQKPSYKRFNVTVHGVAGISDAGEVKSASVNEGDSLTLHTDAELQNDDQIFWQILNKDILLLEFHKLTNRTSLYHSDDVRFRDRLHLNHKTGDLTITNIKAEHTGLYQVEIINQKQSFKRFIVTVHGVFNEEPKSVDVTLSVMEGEAVTLESGVIEIQRNDRTFWMFEETCIAEMNKETGKMSLCDKEIFRDKLLLNTQNGDLTITNIRNKNAGVYQLNIINSEILSKTFMVTVNENVPQPLQIALLAPSVVALIIAAVVIILTNLRFFQLMRRNRF